MSNRIAYASTRAERPQKRLALHVVSAIGLTIAVIAWSHQLDLAQLGRTLLRANPLVLFSWR